MRELPVQLEYAQRWRGRRLCDTETNAIGLVIGAVETDAGVRLEVAFPGELEARLVALARSDDLECVLPGFGRARYRIDA